MSPEFSLNNRQFLTKELDSTGLIYFGARYYDPSIGRFITQDPMGMIDGPNVYFYCLNDPVNYRDFRGFCKNKDLFDQLNGEAKKYGLPLNICIDIVALGGDIISLIPSVPTAIGGYIVGATASGLGTVFTYEQWLNKEAKWYDVGVSATTTVVGFIPGPYGVVSSTFQLIYDLIQNEFENKRR